MTNTTYEQEQKRERRLTTSTRFLTLNAEPLKTNLSWVRKKNRNVVRTAFAIVGALFWISSAVPSDAASLQANYGSGAGAMFGVSVAALTTTNEFVTAIVNGTGNLEMITWSNNPAASEVTRLGSFTAGLVNSSYAGPDGFIGQQSLVAVAAIPNNRFVVAVDTQSGYLEVIVFAVSANGAITRQGSSTVSMPITSVAIAALDATHVVTMATTPPNTGPTGLVSVWTVGSTGTISANPNTFPWEIWNLMSGSSAAVIVISPTQFVVGEGVYSFYLGLQAFSVNPDTSLNEQGSYEANWASYGGLTLEFQNLSNGNFGVALTNSGGWLDISYWNVNASGYISLTAHGQPGISLNGVATFKLANSLFTTGNYGYTTVEQVQANEWSPQNGSVVSLVTGLDSDPAPLNSYSDAQAATALTSNQAVIAFGDSNQNLHVDIWTYNP